MINAYTVMMAAVLFLTLLFRNGYDHKKLYIFLACTAMFCIMGLRDVYTLGNDSASSYLRYFQRMETTQWGDINLVLEQHPGFYLLMKLLYGWTKGNYQLYIAILSAFICFAFGRFIYKHSCSPVQSFVYYWGLLLYIFMFDALKQAMAMSVLLMAYDCILEKRPIKYLILVFCAMLFHFPAIVFLPMYWVARVRINRGYLVVLAFVLALVYLFRDGLLNLMQEVYETEIQDLDMRFLANKVIVMILIVAAGVVLRPPTEEDREYTILLKMMGVAIVFQTFAGYNNTFERLADYYFQFAVLFIPMVFDRTAELSRRILSPFTDKMAKVLGPWVFGAFGIWRFATYMEANVRYMPFRFFFDV